MIKTNKDGYFPYTPPMHMLRALRTATDMLLEEGMDNVFARHHGWPKAFAAQSPPGDEALRQGAEMALRHGQRIILPDGFDSTAMVRHAASRYGLYLGLG